MAKKITKLTKNAAFYLGKCIWWPLVKDFMPNHHPPSDHYPRALSNSFQWFAYICSSYTGGIAEDRPALVNDQKPSDPEGPQVTQLLPWPKELRQPCTHAKLQARACWREPRHVRACIHWRAVVSIFFGHGSSTCRAFEHAWSMHSGHGWTSNEAKLTTLERLQAQGPYHPGTLEHTKT